jgi:hypothetical protein
LRICGSHGFEAAEKFKMSELDIGEEEMDKLYKVGQVTKMQKPYGQGKSPRRQSLSNVQDKEGLLRSRPCGRYPNVQPVREEAVQGTGKVTKIEKLYQMC